MSARQVLSALLLALVAGCANVSSLFRHEQTASGEVEGGVSEARALASVGRFAESDERLRQLAARRPVTTESAEASYWRAVFNLDPANEAGSLDTAITELDAYLGATVRLRHFDEAAALRSLAGNALQLALVRVALREARAEARSDDQSGGPSRVSEDASREVQRLRDELSAARAELERIKKRLANPKP